MSLDTLLRRIDSYLRAARKRLPSFRRLPHIVVNSPSLDVADHKTWRVFEQGELEVSDFSGYEERNAEYQALAQALRLLPKVYGFDAGGIHEEGVREHEALQWEMHEDI